MSPEKAKPAASEADKNAPESPQGANVGERETDKDIQATPTKELFIDMLTRDIALPAAILDLVDNCVDGARRLRKGKSFKGLFVAIELKREHFKITDNCGGIDIKTAREHAFRFGRPDGAPPTKHSIGRFGVGMKRAIFKMGRHFIIESVSEKESFKIDLAVEKWSKAPTWGFDFESTSLDQSNPPAKRGTIITIKNLKKEVADEFELSTFGPNIVAEIRSKLGSAIAKGLKVTVNRKVVKPQLLMMRSRKELRPAYFKQTYVPEEGKAEVTVELYCGLGESEEVFSAGWHIFCNGRKVVVGDKTALTGWGNKSEGVRIPAFHGQFNLIRGYAFFDSDDASVLPWTTTKAGVNADSGIYRKVRREMINLMRPVVTFCNKLKDEKEANAKSGKVGPLASLLTPVAAKALESISCRSAFVMPAHSPSPAGEAMRKIPSYRRRVEIADAVKKHLKATDWREVGEKTFDYYYDNEVDL